MLGLRYINRVGRAKEDRHQVQKKARAKKPNSAQIAQLAGVSRSTVSRVINGYANVNAQTRRRVMEVIKQYGYYPSMSGQVLAGKRVKCLGLFWVANGLIAQDCLSSFFMATTIESAARRGYLVLTCIVPNLREAAWMEHVKGIFYQGRIDAGIFVGCNNQEPLIEQLIDDGMVLGLFDHFVTGREESNRFMINFEADTGERAVDYLVSLGHRRVAVIDGDLNRLSSLQRHEGFLRGLRKNGVELRSQWLWGGSGPAFITKAGGYQAAKAIFGLPGDRPTAICCNNDAAALGVYRAAAEEGIAIGRELSVLGIDGDAGGLAVTPQLTSFQFSFDKMFDSLVDRLIRCLEGEEDVPRLDVGTSCLVERGSCLPAS